jgi:hypothetical protein
MFEEAGSAVGSSVGEPCAVLVDDVGPVGFEPEPAWLAALAPDALPAGTAPGGFEAVLPGLPGLEDVVPGPQLAAVLARIDAADLSDDALVEVVAAWERVRSWAGAVQARALDELTVRSGASTTARRQISAEIGVRLSLTAAAAGRLVDLAAHFRAVPEVADALARGRVDVRRATVLATPEDLPDAAHRQVAAALVGTAAAPGPACRLTAPRIAERLRRAAIAHDPAGAARRHARARADRGVRFEAAGDAMAYLTALLPADDAARTRTHLDRLAVTVARAPGETRTLDQVRADTLVDLLTGTGVSTGMSTGGPGQGTPVAPVRNLVQVTVAATTLLGLDDAPSDLAGYGPIPAALARELAAGPDATWRRILTDPATGTATDVSRTTYAPGTVMGDHVRVRDSTCTFPGCRTPAWRCDLDHITPFDLHAGPGQTRTDNLQAVCRAHHNLKTHSGWDTTRDPGTRAITWQSPLGRRYTTPPRPTDPAHDHHLRDGTHHHPRPEATHYNGRADDKGPSGDGGRGGPGDRPDPPQRGSAEPSTTEPPEGPPF